MLLAEISNHEILDLSIGTLYCYENFVIRVFLRGEENAVCAVRKEYAEALWAYLKSKLTVSPELYPTKE